jgi:hypothetical protein
MSKAIIRINVLRKGDSPPCLTSGQQCRGCFGWPNLLKAAAADAIWRRYPLRCSSTGLTVQILNKPKLGKI